MPWQRVISPTITWPCRLPRYGDVWQKMFVPITSIRCRDYPNKPPWLRGAFPKDGNCAPVRVLCVINRGQGSGLIHDKHFDSCRHHDVLTILELGAQCQGVSLCRPETFTQSFWSGCGKSM